MITRKNTNRVFNKERFLEAYKRNACNITYTVEELGIHYSTYIDNKRKDPSIIAEMEALKESLIDVVEHKLMELITKGNAMAIMFFLKTKARHRGYGESQTITHKGVEEGVKIFLPENKREKRGKTRNKTSKGQANRLLSQ